MVQGTMFYLKSNCCSSSLCIEIILFWVIMGQHGIGIFVGRDERCMDRLPMDMNWRINSVLLDAQKGVTGTRRWQLDNCKGININ